MKRKIEFLARLFDLLKCRNQLLEFLKDEKLITDDIMQTLLAEHYSAHASKIATLLSELQKADKLQLVDYEWTILPFEKLKLTLLTNRVQKEFEYTT
jgi:hypothetical protein